MKTYIQNTILQQTNNMPFVLQISKVKTPIFPFYIPKHTQDMNQISIQTGMQNSKRAWDIHDYGYFMLSDIMLAPILNNQWDDYFFPSFKKCCLQFPITRWFSANVCPRTWCFLQCISLAHVKLHSDWWCDKTYRHTGTKSLPFTTKPERWKVYSSGHCLSDYWSSKLEVLLTKTQGSTRC